MRNGRYLLATASFGCVQR